MKGALFWKRVGNVNVGAYVDSNGKQRVSVRQDHHSAIDMDLSTFKSLLDQARAVVTCMEHADDDTLQERLNETGVLHAIG